MPVPSAGVSGPPRYAVIVSRFPKFTETFILQELRGMEERGLPIELYAITHETPEQLQPAAADLDRRANYIELRSAALWKANLAWLTRRPGRYLRAWVEALWLSRRSTETLVRAPAVVLLAAAMASSMQSKGVERVHAHWATYPALAALVVKRLTGLPYSFTAHAHDIFVDFGGLGTKVHEADLVLTCTDHGRKILVEAGGPGSETKVHLVHHGVNLAGFQQEPLVEPETRTHLHLLCVAALQEYKGHRYLLEACRTVANDDLDITLELIGDGELRGELEALARSLGMHDRIVFRGRQPSAEVRDALARCDAFVLASVQLDSGFMDGIPNVAVEAMAIGRPVIGSNLPGVRELVIDGETGLLAEPRDPGSIAAALRRLIDEPDLAARLVARGRAKVEDEHDASACLDEVYRRLAALSA